MTLPDIPDDGPTLFSGDGGNPHVGPDTAPFAIWDLPTGQTIQITFSPSSCSRDGVVVISRFDYPTPAARRF